MVAGAVLWVGGGGVFVGLEVAVTGIGVLVGGANVAVAMAGGEVAVTMTITVTTIRSGVGGAAGARLQAARV